MERTPPKMATRSAESGQAGVRHKVQAILTDIETGGDAVARRYAAEFDKWDGEIVAARERIAAAAEALPARRRDDIHFAHDNIRRFLEAQKAAVGFVLLWRELP